MPTYDYECDHCGHTFELFQGINEPHKKKCPVCKKMKLRRLFGTGAALLFKGSGFTRRTIEAIPIKRMLKRPSNPNPCRRRKAPTQKRNLQRRKMPLKEVAAVVRPPVGVACWDCRVLRLLVVFI